MAQIDLRHATIKILDGSTNYITIKVGEGDLIYTEKRQLDFVRSRGLLDTVRENEEVPVEVSLTWVWEFITSSSGQPITVEDALKQRNGASAWVSALADSNAPYCVNIEVTYVPPCSGVQTETIVLGQFNYDSLAHQLKDGTVAMKGNCNLTQPLVTRS